MAKEMAQKTGIPKERRVTTPDPVEIPVSAIDGSSGESRIFTPGPVVNYPNIPLLKEAIRRQQGRLRRGCASTRGRSEIKGSTKKPWRQKGTGRARSGTRKSPLWRGGGVTFGPKPRKYDYGLPRKQRRLATRHALLSKLLDGETRVIDGLELERPSTRELGRLLERIGIEKSCLIGVASNADREQVRRLVFSVRNLSRIEVLPVSDFNPLALLKNRSLLLTPGAFDEIESQFGDGGSREETAPSSAEDVTSDGKKGESEGGGEA